MSIFRDKHITALQESIAHWQDIKNCVPGADPTAKQCACCQLNKPGQCFECPIYLIDESHEHCENTPYYDVIDLFDERDFNDTFEPTVQKQIDFLEHTLNQVIKVKEATS